MLFSGRSPAGFLLATVSEKTTDFLLRFCHVPGGLQDGLSCAPLAASLVEPSVDFFWRTKSVCSIQTILGGSEQIRRILFSVGFGSADGLKQPPTLFVRPVCASG